MMGDPLSPEMRAKVEAAGKCLLAEMDLPEKVAHALSPREREAFDLAVRGFRNGAIAQKMMVAKGTVSGMLLSCRLKGFAPPHQRWRNLP